MRELSVAMSVLLPGPPAAASQVSFDWALQPKPAAVGSEVGVTVVGGGAGADVNGKVEQTRVSQLATCSEDGAGGDCRASRVEHGGTGHGEMMRG